MSCYLLLFDTTHAALAVHKAFGHVHHLIIPTPRALSAGCGMTLLFEEPNDARALDCVKGLSAAKGVAHLYVQDEGYSLVKHL